VKSVSTGSHTDHADRVLDYKELKKQVRYQLVIDPHPETTESARRLAERAAEEAPRREDRAAFCQILAQYYANFAQPQVAEKWLDEADRLSQGLPQQQAASAYARVTFLLRQKRTREALKLIEPWMEVVDKEENLSLAARMQTVYAGLLDASGDVAKADEAFRKAIEYREALNERPGLAVVYYNYGEFLAQRDDDLRALEYFHRAFDIEEELGLDAGMAQSASQIALLLARRENKEEAEKMQFIARDAAERSGVPVVIAIIKANAASFYERLGDETKQLNALLEAKTYLDRHPFDSIKGPVLGNLAEIYIKHGRYADADALLDKASHLAEQESNRLAIGHWAFARGQLLHKEGKLEEASVQLRRAVEILSDVKAHIMMLRAFAELAVVQSELGMSSEAARSMAKWAEAYIEEHNQDVEQRLKHLQEVQERERKEKEEEIYRLKNIELSTALEKLKGVNTELRDLASEKDEFMAIAAHDLRNPLADMRNMLQTLLNHYDVLGKDDVLDVARDLLTTTTRMSATVHAFLELSRTDRRSAGIKDEILDIVHMAHRALERHASSAESKNIQIVVEGAGQVWARGDASIVDAVLDNLVSNAVKFAPSDSIVTITVFKGDEHAFIRVSDQGPGIPAADRPKLFTKYTRLSTRPTGGEDSLGLGLYLAKKMAMRMDATLEYEAREEGGATFVFTLQTANPD
jgi:signal transduction histidine kinase